MSDWRSGGGSVEGGGRSDLSKGPRHSGGTAEEGGRVEDQSEITGEGPPQHRLTLPHLTSTSTHIPSPPPPNPSLCFPALPLVVGVAVVLLCCQIARAQAASAWQDSREFVRRHPWVVLLLLFSSIMLGMTLVTSGFAAGWMGKVPLTAHPTHCTVSASTTDSMHFSFLFTEWGYGDVFPPVCVRVCTDTRGVPRSIGHMRRWTQSSRRHSLALHNTPIHPH